jgi:hypothetical protein
MYTSLPTSTSKEALVDSAANELVAVDFHGWTEKLHREVSREKEYFLRR